MFKKYIIPEIDNLIGEKATVFFNIFVFCTANNLHL